MYKIGCDLMRNLTMFRLPIKEFGEFKDDIVFVDPNSISNGSLDNVEIYLGDRITTDMVKYIPKLKWIHLTSVGVDKLMGFDRDDIIVTNSKGIMDSSVISTALAFIFSLSRGINYCLKERVDRYKFDKYFDNIQDVIGQSCLIVGMGNIGKKLKYILESLDMNVVGIRQSNRNDLMDYIQSSDFVVNLLPLTKTTKYIFNKKIFINMKSSSYFINVGRGQTVVEDDLIWALKNNIISGAGLDVFENEPLSMDSELWDIDNVILTPHIAGYSNQYWKKQKKLFSDNLKRYLNAEPMLNEIKLC